MDKVVDLGLFSRYPFTAGDSTVTTGILPSCANVFTLVVLKQSSLELCLPTVPPALLGGTVYTLEARSDHTA